MAGRVDLPPIRLFGMKFDVDGNSRYKADRPRFDEVDQVLNRETGDANRNRNNVMPASDMRDLLDAIDSEGLKNGSVKVEAGANGTYIFKYKQDTPAIRLDPEAAKMAYESGAFQWNAPVPGVAQQATRGNAAMMDEMEAKPAASTAARAPASSPFLDALGQAETLVKYWPKQNALLTDKYLDAVDSLPKAANGSIIIEKDESYTNRDGKRVTFEAGTYSLSAFHMAVDNFIGSEQSGTTSVANAVANFQNAKAGTHPNKEFVGEVQRLTNTPTTPQPRELTAEEINDRPSIYAREDAMRVAVAPTTTAPTTTAPAVAATVAAMPAPQPAPSAPTPQMAAPSAGPDIFNRIAGEISSAGQVRTANDDARAVEAFLKANPVIGADGKPLTDTRAGFKDDGILSEQEATAALNRAQALRWATGGKAAEALTALEASLNPTSATVPLQAQANSEVTPATAEPAAKGPTQLTEGVNGFDKALAEAKAVRAETLQTTLVMDNTTLVGGADQATQKSLPVIASVQSSGMGASI